MNLTAYFKNQSKTNHDPQCIKLLILLEENTGKIFLIYGKIEFLDMTPKL